MAVTDRVQNVTAFTLPPPLTDLSDRGLTAAIEADLVATRVLAPEVPVEIHADPDATWGMSFEPDLYRCIVASARFGAEAADRRIAEIADAYAARGTGFMWWSAPFHTPHDLGDRLQRAGLRLEGGAPAMAMDLHDLPGDEPPPAGLEIEGVRDAAGLEAMIDVIRQDSPAVDGMPSPMPPRFVEALLEAIPSRLGDEPLPLRYVGRIDGRPVATSRLSIGGGVAGVYTVLTLPEFRGRGIGRAMTLAALRAGRELGYRIGVLQSTEEGYPVYRRLGFREIFTYQVYERLPPRP